GGEAELADEQVAHQQDVVGRAVELGDVAAVVARDADEQGPLAARRLDGRLPLRRAPRPLVGGGGAEGAGRGEGGGGQDEERAGERLHGNGPVTSGLRGAGTGRRDCTAAPVPAGEESPRDSI